MNDIGVDLVAMHDVTIKGVPTLIHFISVQNDSELRIIFGA